MPAEEGQDWLCRTICYAIPSKKSSEQDPDTCLPFHTEAEARLPQQRKSPPSLNRSEGEQVAKQSKVGLNAQESFTEMDESGNLKDRVWVQMHQFDSIEIKKAPEELVGGQCKSSIKEGLKDHQLTSVGSGEELPIGGAPPDERFLWKHLVDFTHTSSGCGTAAIAKGKSKIWARSEFPGRQKALIERWLKNEEQRRQIWGGVVEIAAARIL